MKRALHTVVVAAAVVLAGCIVEFVPSIRYSDVGLVIVDGVVTDGETIISVFVSDVLPSTVPQPGYIAQKKIAVGARVWVESEAGASFPSVEIVDAVEVVRNKYLYGTKYIDSMHMGRHSIDNGALDDNTRYRVRVEYGGEEYVSTWRPPQSTPPIEKIEFYPEGDMVKVRLDVRGEADGVRNYMWSYEEVWEKIASINASHYYALHEGEYNERTYSLRDVQNAAIIGLPAQVFRYPGEYSPFYYCWKYNNSQQVLIADTKKLSENSLHDHVLFEFGVSDDRLSYLYHLKLNQWTIGDDAHLYFTVINENTVNMGSIFGPIPSEMSGNVTCTTSPEIDAIGFVEVSHGAVTELFLESADSPYLPLPSDCRVAPVIEDDGDGNKTFIVTAFGLPDMWMYSYIRCIDCREEGGQKRKPGWWTNDHK